MSFWLEPEVQQYFLSPAFSDGLQQEHQRQPQHLLHARFPNDNPQLMSELRAAAVTAFVEDPALSFILRLDSILAVRRCIVTCLATVRRNVHQFELLYLQRFKQIAEPAVRHPKSRERSIFCIDPKTLRCGQQVLVKVQLRQSPSEPLQLLREFAVLKASSSRDPAVFPKAYLFGCLGDDIWHLTSADTADQRILPIHKRHYLICQHAEDSLQRLLEINRGKGQCLPMSAVCQLARDMLYRLKHLHGLGWSHGDLRPSCFLMNGSPDDLLLGDFTSATPLSQDCLKFDERFDQRDQVWCSERFSSETSSIFGDLESLVYIMCALSSPVPLPWEAPYVQQEAVRSQKLAVWQFAEATEPEVKAELWSPAADGGGGGFLTSVFNSASAEEASEHPACKLASAVISLRLIEHDNPASAATGGSYRLPDYGTLFACFKE